MPANTNQPKEFDSRTVRRSTNEIGERDRLDEALDEGLKETFPASDAVTIVQPAPEHLQRDRGKS
jgi:hypothetical protein